MRLVLPPAIWLAHFSAVYVLLSLVCANRAAARTLPGMDPVIIGVGVTTVVALVAIGATAFTARRACHGADEVHAFAARVGMLLAVLSAIGVVWVAYPAFLLPACVS